MIEDAVFAQITHLRKDIDLLAWLHAEKAYQCDVVTWLHAEMAFRMYQAAAKRMAEAAAPAIQQEIMRRLQAGSALVQK